MDNQIEEMAIALNETTKKVIFVRSPFSLYGWEKISKELFNQGYRKIPEGSVVISKEEYERFQRIENTLKRISTILPTEAESENNGQISDH